MVAAAIATAARVSRNRLEPGRAQILAPTHANTRVMSVTFRGSQRRRGVAIRPRSAFAADTRLRYDTRHQLH
jgi:hypothetical protein